MRMLLAGALFWSLNVFSQNLLEKPVGTNPPKDCRQAIVETSAALREPLSPSDFSVDVDSKQIAPEIFNALSSEEQEKIYMKLKPLEVMVAEMIEKANSAIAYLGRNSTLNLWRIDLLENLRRLGDELRNCVQAKTKSQPLEV